MTYTLLEAAKELGFTKNAVKYRIKKLPPECIHTDKNGIIRITAEGLDILREQMGKKAQSDNNRQTTDQEPTNNHQKAAETEQQTTQEPTKNHETTTKENSSLLMAIEALTSQLAVKDEQIAAKDRQIETLTEALKAAQQTANAAQALHAGTLQKELTEAQDNAEQASNTADNKHSEINIRENDVQIATDNKKRRSFWEWLTGK